MDYAGYQIKNETWYYRVDERCKQSFGGKPYERGHLEDLGQNGKILTFILN
jgi:hypothetical protein